MKCRKCRAEIPDGSKFCCACGAKQEPEKRKALKRANGTGTVYKLQGRRRRPWVAAKGKVIVGYYETKTAALEALNRLTGRSLDERYNMTFTDVFEAWKLEHYKELITQMSKWAIREELITTNFASFVKLPENIKKEKEIFTDDDIRILEADGSETAKIILMLIYTGMRIGELFSLPLEDYHETYVVGGEKTEAGRNWVIPIRPEGRGYFRYFADHAVGPLLLSGYTGDRVAANFRRRNYYPLLNKLGIERKPPTPRGTPMPATPGNPVCRRRFCKKYWVMQTAVPPRISMCTPI